MTRKYCNKFWILKPIGKCSILPLRILQANPCFVQGLAWHLPYASVITVELFEQSWRSLLIISSPTGFSHGLDHKNLHLLRLHIRMNVARKHVARRFPNASGRICL